MRPSTRVLLPILALTACGSSTNPGSGGGSSTSSATSGTTSTSATTTSGTTTGSGGATGTGGAGQGGAGTGGASPDCAGIDATFTAVLAKPLSGCGGFEPPCHKLAAGELRIDPNDPAMTFAALVNVDTTIVGAGKRVVPGDPVKSFLYRKLIDDLGPDDGAPMPEPGGLANPMWNQLPQDEIDIVRCWIAGGAKND